MINFSDAFYDAINIIFNLDTKRYCNNELKYYFEIIYNEYDFLNLQNCFNTLYNNVNKNQR